MAAALHLIVTTAVLAVLVAIGTARGGTDTGQLIVTATVQTQCALSSGNLDFGQYIAGQTADLDALGSITYANCNGSLVFELDGGQSGNVNDRTMTFNSAILRYQIFRNATRTSVWGIGSSAQNVTLFVPQSSFVAVYGRIPGGQSVAAGTYIDTVNITLRF